MNSNKIKYTIIKINDRCINSIEKNKKILNNFEYIEDIAFCNAKKNNPILELEKRGISLSTWSPYDGRSMPPLMGELGIWVSLINILEYICKNNIDMFLVLEDDIELQDDFVEKLNLCIKDLPNNFDFLSLRFPNEQNNVTEATEIGSKYIHKSTNQYANGQGFLFSYNGAKSILKIVKRLGIEYTTDCFIFRQSMVEAIQGFSIKKDSDFLIKDPDYFFMSEIDPENKRHS